MNIGEQIKHYRKYYQYSQEKLAEKIYVSRQTVSNWENNHSYPDFETILMLSVLFDVSLDQLVKGDLNMMRKEILKHSKRMNYWAYVMVSTLFVSAVLFGVVFNSSNSWWMILLGLFLAISLHSSIKIEGIKKQNNLDTYEKIDAFSKGQSTENIHSKKSWKDWCSFVIVPLSFIVVMLFSSYIF